MQIVQKRKTFTCEYLVLPAKLQEEPERVQIASDLGENADTLDPAEQVGSGSAWLCVCVCVCVFVCLCMSAHGC